MQQTVTFPLLSESPNTQFLNFQNPETIDWRQYRVPNIHIVAIHFIKWQQTRGNYWLPPWNIGTATPDGRSIWNWAVRVILVDLFPNNCILLSSNSVITRFIALLIVYDSVICQSVSMVCSLLIPSYKAICLGKEKCWRKKDTWKNVLTNLFFSERSGKEY